MLTLAMILSYLESLIIVPVAIPGIKTGLANLAVVFLIYRAGWKEALCVNLCRIVLSSLLFGSLPGFVFSVFGAALSFICMLMVKRLSFSSSLLTAMAGGVMHNLGQLIAAMLMFSQNVLGYYLPVLMITGLAAGALVGGLSEVLVKKVPYRLL